MNHKDRVHELEAEIVGYRVVIESVRLMCRMRPSIDSVPLYNLCQRALSESAGSEVAQEFSFLRALEAISREGQLLAENSPLDSEDSEWQQRMAAVVLGRQECLQKLDLLRKIQADTVKAKSSILLSP